MNNRKGWPLPLGVSEKEGYINFSVAVPSGKECVLKLYEKGADAPKMEVPLLEKDAVGLVRFACLKKNQAEGLEYIYEIENELKVDPYARSVVEAEGRAVRGRILPENYDWEEDKPLCIPYRDVIAYSLHVRGFTKHTSSGVREKGTFSGIIEKIPYLKELGINQIQCMPVYAFEEGKGYQNYWGYGNAFCFAIKERYGSRRESSWELKDMIKACHKAGIEVVLNLPFTEQTPKQMITECLRYYVMEFHADGFLLNPYHAPMDSILGDPILGNTKILVQNEDFQNVMRRFLRGEEGMTEGVKWALLKQTKNGESCSCITGHTGFTLADLYSYEEKHNEANGENNQDGPNFNYSWNCGVEGPTRKRAVLKLRKKQMKNALFLLLTAQASPVILAGDEFGNSQNGNNNVYCQDNEVSWLNWKQLEKEKELLSYVKTLIALRKTYQVLHMEGPLLGVDRTSCGVPDVSFHGESAWQTPSDGANRMLGVYYHSRKEEITDCFLAYNMYSDPHSFALPTLPKGKKWYRIFSSEDWELLKEEPVTDKAVQVEGRTAVLFAGK